MDIADVGKLSSVGLGLNIEERAGLKAAMLKLRHEQGVAGLKFWGKVAAAQGARDYIICSAVNAESSFPAKRFYYCLGGGNFELKQLATRAMSAEQEALARSLHATYTFEGDPTKPLEEEKTEELKEGEDDITAADATYREVHHLAYVVWAVDNSTSVVPKGSVMVDEKGRLVPNPSFAGLSAGEAKSISSYYHFRNPQGRAAEWANKSGACKAEDVLDQVGGPRAAPQGPSPVGAWAVSVNSACTDVVVRSLEYPGYFFVHELGTNKHGGAYFGDGKFNQDLGFMV